MDTIKYLIGFFFKLAFAALFVALIWWLVSLLFPALSFSQLKAVFSGEEKRDILPSPRAYSGLFKVTNIPTATSNLYVHGQAFQGYSQSPTGEFLTYGSKSTGAAQPTTAPTRSMYIRNLSIYENGHVYTGLSFVGEARNEMFSNGGFRIVIIDQRGGLIGTSRAIKQENWSVPGWSRFSVKVQHVLPPGGVPCSMIFEQDIEQFKYSGTTAQPVRVGIPIKCN
jgi:hypothetical protein